MRFMLDITPLELQFLSGMEAIQYFKNFPCEVDVVITDMTMPDITGSELAVQLFNIRPDIPLILCTGFSDLIDKEKAFSLGIKDYLMKPVCRKDLARSVRKVLDEY